MPYNILLVVKDPQGKELQAGLANEFRQVQVCARAQDAVEAVRGGGVNLAVVESDLPDMPGTSLLKIFREMESGKGLPVIFLARQKTPQILSDTFALGIDDFLVQPCDPRELSVRVRAVLRRRFERIDQWAGPLSLGGIEIDASQRSCVAGKDSIQLRPLEFALLEILMRKAGRVLTRQYLLTTVWNMSDQANTRTVDAAVSRLRRCLGKRYARSIQTVSKMGYCFRVNN